MKDIENMVDPGMRIARVAALLVQNAPARVAVNGVTMRARYATTKPRDIEAQYWRSLAIRYPRAASVGLPGAGTAR